jgi:hypothetical protein
MKIEEVRKLLQDVADFRLLFCGDQAQNLVFETNDSRLIHSEVDALRNNFWNNGLEIWSNEHRVAVTKVYESFTYFNEFWKDDQITISDLLNFLPLKYKNNLYFLIVLDFDREDGLNNKLLTEKNKAEKNAKYCRKYIIQESADLERIPFFHVIDKEKADHFSYEKRFIDMLVTGSQGIDSDIAQVIKDYFKPEMRNLINDKNKLRAVIEKRFGEEISHEFTPDKH